MIKLIVEILLAIFLHPLVWVLCVINIVTRADLSGVKKLIWIIVTFVWGIGPILYVLLGDGGRRELRRTGGPGQGGDEHRSERIGNT